MELAKGHEVAVAGGLGAATAAVGVYHYGPQPGVLIGGGIVFAASYALIRWANCDKPGLAGFVGCALSPEAVGEVLGTATSVAEAATEAVSAPLSKAADSAAPGLGDVVTEAVGGAGVPGLNYAFNEDARDQLNRDTKFACANQPFFKKIGCGLHHFFRPSTAHEEDEAERAKRRARIKQEARQVKGAVRRVLSENAEMRKFCAKYPDNVVCQTASNASTASVVDQLNEAIGHGDAKVMARDFRDIQSFARHYKGACHANPGMNGCEYVHSLDALVRI